VTPTPDRTLLSPGDVVRFPRPDGKTGAWEVRGVLIGAVGQESVYGVRVIDLDHPHDEYGLRITQMYVPCCLLEAIHALEMVA
jgi:hypothetical protein